ncbi:MAG: tyrosine--tRNA ligase [Nitrospinota bacterium]|nr:tyrosine--tRNA ligase [Nitrospinota bacterium]
MNIVEDLEIRGLLHDYTDNPEMISALSTKSLPVYCGFDPTATSLHVGSLMPIVSLARFQKYGHTPIILIGGGTGMIGDPAGKSEERNLLDEAILEKNIAGIKSQLQNLIDFKCGSNSAKILNNNNWLSKMNMIEFLRDIGKNFSIGYMMSKESVKNRINERGISYTEFTYMILQAYDFLHLFDTEKCQLQIGGSDQWGNITAGIELVRRMRGKNIWGITFPLITTSSGRKFGKTEEGNIWLDPELTSAYQFYQYWIQTNDEDVIKFLSYFTFLAKKEIKEIATAQKDNPEKREAQLELARLLTTFVHGGSATESALRVTDLLFTGKIDGISEEDLVSVSNEMPYTLYEGKLPILLTDILTLTGVSKSKTMSRNDIAGGGIYLNNERITEEKTEISKEKLLFDKYVLLRKGKKNYHLVEMKK